MRSTSERAGSCSLFLSGEDRRIGDPAEECVECFRFCRERLVRRRATRVSNRRRAIDVSAMRSSCHRCTFESCRSATVEHDALAMSRTTAWQAPLLRSPHPAQAVPLLQVELGGTVTCALAPTALPCSASSLFYAFVGGQPTQPPLALSARSMAHAHSGSSAFPDIPTSINGHLVRLTSSHRSRQRVPWQPRRLARQRRLLPRGERAGAPGTSKGPT